MADVQIITGDCRELLASIPDASVDCILTDPPYGETSLGWDRWIEGWPALVRRLLKPTGSMWVFGSQRMFFERATEFAGWRLAQDVVWEKHNGSGFASDRFKRVHECALQFYPDGVKWASVYKEPQFTLDAVARSVRKRGRTAHTGEIGSATNYQTVEGGPRLMRSVIFARSEHGRAIHPTQKPIGVVEPLLLYACPVGGTVLDPFAGSGTTGIVAKRHGINAILIEADERFAAASRDRIADDAPLFAEASHG